MDSDRPLTFSNNRFVDTVFVFTGAATPLLYMLETLYHAALGIDDGLIRLSVGVEAIDDLLAELEYALPAA